LQAPHRKVPASAQRPGWGTVTAWPRKLALRWGADGYASRCHGKRLLMRDVRPGYLVRDAGSPSRPGRVFKMYPYTLRSLLDALDDARLRSYADGP
jgi:hypothetical protein